MDQAPASKSSQTGTPENTANRQDNIQGEQPEPKFVTIKSGKKIDINATEYAGKLTNVIFHKGDFAIVKIDGVTCKGKLGTPQPNAHYSLVGKFSENKKFLGQWDFEFSSFTVRIDESAGLRELLIREAPGIGPVVASKIVTYFGKDAIQTLCDNPGTVAQQISGLSMDACYKLQEWAQGIKKNALIKEKLYAIGLKPFLVERLLSHYGADAEKKIKEDCFSLIGLPGIGFKTAASIADMLGIPKSNPGRLKAAIMYSIEKMTEQGSTCIPRTELLRHVCGLTGVDQNPVEVQLDKLIESKDLLTEKTVAADYCFEIGRVN